MPNNVSNNYTFSIIVIFKSVVFQSLIARPPTRQAKVGAVLMLGIKFHSFGVAN